MKIEAEKNSVLLPWHMLPGVTTETLILGTCQFRNLFIRSLSNLIKHLLNISGHFAITGFWLISWFHDFNQGVRGFAKRNSL